MSELVWEVIMTRNGAIKNAFFSNIERCEKILPQMGKHRLARRYLPQGVLIFFFNTRSTKL
jgi:hypothetical protein